MKVAKQKDKEWQKAQNRKDRNSSAQAQVEGSRRNIEFQNNVVLLEAAARNDIAEVRIQSYYISILIIKCSPSEHTDVLRVLWDRSSCRITLINANYW